METKILKSKFLQELLIVFGVAITYFLFGKLSFFITIEPGNVSPIWPPAGVALLAILFLGNKVLYGVFLGSFFVNVTFYLNTQNKNFILTGFIISTIIALGAVTQTIIAKVLFYKICKSDYSIESVANVLKFALLVAPISVIVNSSVSVITLFLFRLIEVKEILLTWSTWWLGDFAGTILFALLGLILKPRTSQEKISLGVSANVFIVAILSAVLAIFASYAGISSIQSHKKILIGISRWGNSPEYDKNITGFKQSLSAAGFIEGKNIEYIIKNPETNKDKQKEIISEFINRRVDLIYTLTTPGTIIAKELTSRMEVPIPVVFSIVTYPVETKVIDSLENSKNNLVGTRNYIPLQRQWNIFKALFPDTKKLGFVHRKNEPNSTYQLNEMLEISKHENVAVVEIATDTIDELKTKINEFNGKIDALYSACDTMIQTGGEDIANKFAKEHKLPDFACLKSGVIKGALLANTTDFGEIGKISGQHAVIIIKNNKKPWELKTESPENDTVVLNLKRSDELNLMLSTEFMNRVSEVIR